MPPVTANSLPKVTETSVYSPRSFIIKKLCIYRIKASKKVLDSVFKKHMRLLVRLIRTLCGTRTLRLLPGNGSGKGYVPPVMANSLPK